MCGSVSVGVFTTLCAFRHVTACSRSVFFVKQLIKVVLPEDRQVEPELYPRHRCTLERKQVQLGMSTLFYLKIPHVCVCQCAHLSED